MMHNNKQNTQNNTAKYNTQNTEQNSKIQRIPWENPRVSCSTDVGKSHD